MEYKTDWSVEGTPEQQEEFAKIITDKTGIVLDMYSWGDKPICIATEHSKGYRFLSGGYNTNNMGMVEPKRLNHFILPQEKEKALDYILEREEGFEIGDVLCKDYGDFNHVFIPYKIGKYLESNSLLDTHKNKFETTTVSSFKFRKSNIRKATPEEVKWLEACEKAGEFVSKEDALKECFGTERLEFTPSTIGSLDGSKSNPVTHDDTASIGGLDVDLILKDIIDTSINTSQRDFKTDTIKETAGVDGNYTIGVDPYTRNLLDILDSRMLGWIKKENNKKDLDDSKKIHKLAIENDTEEPKELKVFKTNINKLKL